MIGVAANVTQWTSPGSRHKKDKRVILYFCTSILPDFSKSENGKEENNALHTKTFKKLSSAGLEPRLSGPHRANFVVLGIKFGYVSFDDFERKERNASRDAHLGRLGFPKMYKSLL